MSCSLPRASAPWTIVLATAAVTALAGCESTSTTEDGAVEAAPAATSSPAPDTDSVDGQTEGVAPAPDPAVVLTYAGYDEAENTVTASAFLTGAVEEDGRCRLVVHQDDDVVEASRDATPSATTTDCGNLSVELPDGADGTWEAAVTYTSSAHEGTSEARTVELP